MYIIGVLAREVRRRKRGAFVALASPYQVSRRGYVWSWLGWSALLLLLLAPVRSERAAVTRADPACRPARWFQLVGSTIPWPRGSPTAIRRFLLLSSDHAVRNRH